MTVDKVQVGKRLRDVRESRNETIKQVSEATGLSESALRNYECGYRLPRYEAIIELSDHFDLPIDAFFSS